MRVVSLAYDTPTGLLFIPIKDYLKNNLKKVWELWPAQDFSLRRGNYITKKVRIVLLACDTSTGPPLHSYQMSSKYTKVKGYKVMKRTRMWRRTDGQTDAMLITISPEAISQGTNGPTYI